MPDCKVKIAATFQPHDPGKDAVGRVEALVVAERQLVKAVRFEDVPEVGTVTRERSILGLLISRNGSKSVCWSPPASLRTFDKT